MAEYAERVFAWSLRRTPSRQEAEELTQQILLEALVSLPNLLDDTRFQGWIWALAGNVYKRWLYRSGRDQFYNVCLANVELSYREDGFDRLLQDDENARLVRSVATLSQQWRDMLVWHYFDGDSVASIAQKLGIPPGTVKWRLHQARIRVKEEMDEVNTAGAAVLRQVKLNVSMGGEGNYPMIGPWPQTFVNRRAAQSIALAAYDHPVTVEEISRATGIPAYFVEDELRTLVDHELMSVTDDKYRTEFLILRRQALQEIEEVLCEHAAVVAEPFVEKMTAAQSEIENVGYNSIGKTFAEQLWTLIPFAFCDVALQGQVDVNTLRPPQRKDGGRWYVRGQENAELRNYGFSQNRCGAMGGKVLLTIYTSHGVCREVRFSRLPNSAEVAILYSSFVRKFDTDNLIEHDREWAIKLINDGYLERTDGRLAPKVLFMNREQYDELYGIFTELLKDFSATLEATRQAIFAIYDKSVPAHLAEQARYDASYKVTQAGAYVMKHLYDERRLSTPLDPRTAGVFLLERSK